MGKNYVESSLKRFLKRKVKVTLGMVVAFLISGSIGFATDTVEPTPNQIFGNLADGKIFDFENGKITISSKISHNGSSIDWQSARGYSNDEKVFNGNIGIKHSGSDPYFASMIRTSTPQFTYDGVFNHISEGTGMTISQLFKSSNKKYRNNGLIYFDLKKEKLDNEGYANYIVYFDSPQNQIINNGYIYGKGIVAPMTATANVNGEITNNGMIDMNVYGESAGLLIYNYATQKVNQIKNNGVIQGTASDTNFEETEVITTFQSLLSGIKSKNVYAQMNNLANNGLINLSSENLSGYIIGIELRGDYLKELENNGKISVVQKYLLEKDFTKQDIRTNGIFLDIRSKGEKVESNISNSGVVERKFIGGRDTYFSGDAAIEIETGIVKDFLNKGLISSINIYTLSLDSLDKAITDSYGLKIYDESDVEKSYIKNLNNMGIISGISEGNTKGFGVGIRIGGSQNRTEEKTFENSGIIEGTEVALHTRGSALKEDGTSSGLHIKGKNLGLMITKGDSIFSSSISGGTNISIDGTDPNNYLKIINVDNKGLYIKINQDDTHNIINDKNEIITSADQKVDNTNNVINGKIENGQVKSIDLADNKIDLANKGYIFNGFDKTLNITEKDKDLKIKDSVINGYKTAVYLDGGKAELKNTVINGGLDIKYNEKGEAISETGAIVGADGKDNTLILANSTVNGKIDFGTGNDTLELKRDEAANTLGYNYLNKDVSLGAGNDKMSISSNTFINGTIDGETGKDTLNLGDVSTADVDKEKYAMDIEDNVIRVFGEIKNFEDINVTGQVHLYETAKVNTDNKGGKIYINNDSSLNLRIDPTVNENGKITGHALYNSGYTISGAGTVQEGEYEGKTSAGTLNFVTNGIGHGGVIGMGNTVLDDYLNIRTDSLIHSAVKDGADIKIEVVDELEKLGYQDSVIVKPTPEPEPENPEGPDKPITSERRYPQLNKIYKSIISSGNQNINAINPTVTAKPDELDYDTDVSTDVRKYQLGNLLTLLNDIYANNPYAFSHDLSKESMKMFSDTVFDSPFRPFEKHWLVYGGLTHNNTETKDTYYGKHLHEFDLKSMKNDVEIESKIYGAYARAEYGNSNEVSTGIILGGNKSKSEFGNGASLDGNAAYLGGYIKREKDNWKLLGGIGAQYSEYESKRIAENMVQHFSYNKDYSDYGFNAYLGAKYDYKINEEYSLEPNIKLEYSYIKQESISEKPQDLAIDVDSQKFQSLDGKVGIDLKKVKFDEDKKSTFRVGVGYNYNFDGDEDQYLTGRMKGGRDFDILSPNKENDRVSFNVGYEVEKESGWVYDIKGTYSLTAKGHNGVRIDSDTRNQRDSWSVGIGIGFKFNDIEDFTFAASSLFDFDKSIVKPEGKEMIKNASEIINKKKLKGTLSIEGHTDWTGTEEYNQILSEKRAKAVKEEFKENVTNENIKYETKGYGETRPVADNKTKEGRAKNRRVEVKFNENQK